MKKVISLIAIVLMIGFIACESGGEKRSYKINNPNLREVVVKEILQTSSYTYLQLKEENAVYWGAIPRRDDIEVGNTYYFDNFMEMKDFPSKELDRTFDNIYFIQSISDKPYPAPTQMKGNQQTGSSHVGDMEIENVKPAEGGITIGQLFDNKKDYEGKTVLVKGKVVKFTAAVMGKNWVHIQDGTRSGNNVDLTITTADVVNNGDIVTFEGTVYLDKDFGYGYAYDVIIEEATLKDTESSPSLQ